MELWILFGSFFLLIAFNVPIAFALGISAAITIIYDGLPLMVEVQRIASGIGVFSLLAIPFFIYAGELMLYGGIAERIVPSPIPWSAMSAADWGSSTYWRACCSAASRGPPWPTPRRWARS